MCNYSITTNQAAIIALFRVVNRYVGNLAPMPGVFPDYPVPVGAQRWRRARADHDAPGMTIHLVLNKIIMQTGSRAT